MNKRAKRPGAAIAALRSLEPRQGQISSAGNGRVHVFLIPQQLHEDWIRLFEGREPTAADLKRKPRRLYT